MLPVLPIAFPFRARLESLHICPQSLLLLWSLARRVLSSIMLTSDKTPRLSMTSVSFDAAQSTYTQLDELVDEFKRQRLCSQERLAAAEGTIKTLLVRSVSAEVESKEIDLEAITLASKFSQQLLEVNRALRRPSGPAEQLQRDAKEQTPEEMFLQIQNGVAALISAPCELSTASMAALLHLISRMVTTREKLEEQYLAAYEQQLVDTVCPALLALQLLVAAMGRDLAALPPPALLTKVAYLVGTSPDTTDRDPVTPPELCAWMSTVLDKLEEQTARVTSISSTEPGYINLRTQARAIIADLQNQFFARSCSLFECGKSQRAVQR